MSNENIGLRFTGLTDQLSTDIKNIAKNKGIPVSDFLKPIIREIVREYPQEAKTKKVSDKKDIKIYGIAPVIHEDLINICSHLGIEPSSFLKVHVYRIIKDYPATLKQPPKDY